jgi:hypothetical protein
MLPAHTAAPRTSIREHITMHVARAHEAGESGEEEGVISPLRNQSSTVMLHCGSPRPNLSSGSAKRRRGGVGHGSSEQLNRPSHITATDRFCHGAAIGMHTPEEFRPAPCRPRSYPGLDELTIQRQPRHPNS